MIKFDNSEKYNVRYITLIKEVKFDNSTLKIKRRQKHEKNL